MTRNALLAALAICLPMAAQAAPELIQNGNFQLTDTTSSNGNFQLTNNGTYGTVTGWTTTNSSSNTNPYNILFRTSAKGNDTPNNANTFQSTSTAYSPSAAGSGAYGQYSSTQSTAANSNERLAAGYNSTSQSGGNFMALDGDTNVNGYLSQVVTGLTVGSAYTLQFYWAVAELVTGNSAPNGLTETLKIGFGTSTASTATVGIADGGFSGWMKASFTFTAAATSQTLSFLSIGTPSGAPPFALLDGVSLQAAPEPATWAVMAVGLVGLAGVVRLRRRQSNGSAAA